MAMSALSVNKDHLIPVVLDNVWFELAPTEMTSLINADFGLLRRLLRRLDVADVASPLLLLGLDFQVLDHPSRHGLQWQVLSVGRG